MHGQYIERILEKEVIACLRDFPAVAILGPRQCGKSTLARNIIRNAAAETVYLDLELPSDIQKLSEPELFLRQHSGKLICLDEIQRMPEIFPVLRSIIDEDRGNRHFLILGSASPELIKQSSETLAGRIAYLELTPLLHQEILPTFQDGVLAEYWARGGMQGVCRTAGKQGFLDRHGGSRNRNGLGDRTGPGCLSDRRQCHGVFSRPFQ
jgi:predicted AAA+ superfamily ATPase